MLAKEYKARVKQLIEMNRITVARGDIGFNFTDNNLIKNHGRQAHPDPAD